MILLDTDMITLLHGPPSTARDRLVQRLEDAADAGEEVVVSIISFEEQMRGWLSYISRAKDPVRQIDGYERLHRLLDQYQRVRVLDFDATASSQYQSLRAAHRRANTMDLRIAAVAIAHDAVLLSGNARDFLGIPNLRFERYTG
jgi:tRNA(fMet)-specific endonuclease VapC